MLTSQARETLKGVRTLMLDEVHAVAGTKRGAHFALTVERLEQRSRSRSSASAVGDAAPARGDRPLRRGRPADRARRRRPREGARPPGRHARRGHARAAVDLGALVPGAGRRPGDGRGHRAELAVDLAVDLPGDPEARPRASLDDRVRQQPAACGAARTAPERARRGRDRARPPRLDRARAAGRDRGALEARRDPVPRRHLVARARHRHGRRRPRDPGREPEVGGARAAAGGPRGPRAGRRLARADLPEVPRRPARVGGRRAAHARRRHRGDADPA